MGTVSFDGKFDGMRKAQDFIVYPMHEGNSADSALVQSDTRIGRIDLQTGAVIMSPSRMEYTIWVRWEPNSKYVEYQTLHNSGRAQRVATKLASDWHVDTTVAKHGSNPFSAALEVFKAA